MRNLRKSFGIILVIFGMVLFPKITYADLSCDATYNITEEKDSCTTLNFGTFKYGMNIYSVSSANGGNIKAYCIDPFKKNGAAEGAKCVRRVDPSKKGDYQAVDVAYTKAYQMLMEKNLNSNSTHHKVLGETIFRWLEYSLGTPAGSFSQTTVCHGTETVTREQINSIFNPPSYLNWQNLWQNVSEFSADEKKAMIEIYTSALSLGKKIQTGATYESVVGDGDDKIIGESYDVKIESNIQTNGDMIVVTLTPKNLDKYGGATINWNDFKVGCDSGVTCTKVNGEPNGDGYRFTIKVSAKNGYALSNSGIYIESSISGGSMLSTTNMIIVRGSDAQQRMLLVSDGTPILNAGTKISITGEPNKNTGESCSFKNNKYYCKDGHECSEPEYRADCENINCMPTVTMPSNCNNFDEESTEKGIISDINEESNRTCSNGAVNNANQVKSCVIGHNDLTNTSYEATTELSDNPYCKVYCKEKYTFTLPTAKITRSGGYFTLSTTVDATRDCYVGNAVRNAKGEIETQGINTTLFQTTLSDLRVKMITAWNNYSYYKAAYEAATSSKYHEETKTAGQGTCSHTEMLEDGTYSSYTTPGAGPEDYTYVKIDEWSAPQYSTTTGARIADKKGSYEDGSGSCGCNSCSINNGKNPSDDYKNEMNKYQAKYQDYLSKIAKNIQQYNSCSGDVPNKALGNYETSSTNTTWSNKMAFKPVVTFDYNENYKKDITGEFEQIDPDKDKVKSGTIMYCSGEINDDYTCQSGATSTPQKASQNVISCDDNGCTTVAVDISTAKWVQKSKTASATYEPKNEFATYSPYGTIKLKNKACNGNDCLYSKMPENALPISMITKTGVFPFTIKYSDIGQDNKTGALGRLMGATTSVITEYDNLTDDIRCAADSSTKTVDQNVGYVCHYLNNCDNCKFTCTDDNNCEFTEKECDGDNCRMTCKNCAFDGSTANFTYRTISTNNLNPTSRSLGYNWNADTGENAKAVATTKAIEEDGDKVYKKAQYSYTLTPSNLQKIREYNKQAESFTNASIPSGYQKYVENSNSLYCEQLPANASDGKSYEIPYRCKSTFLDLANNNSTGLTSRDNRVRVTADTDAFENFSGCTSGYGNGNCKYVGPSWRIKGAE